MKRFGLHGVVLGGLFLSAAIARSDEPVALPDTPAGKQMRALLDALATGKRDRIQSFIQENFADSFLRAVPLEKHVEVNAGFATQTGGVVPREIVASTPTSLRLYVTSRKGGEKFAVAVEVEKAAPHKITRMGVRRPEPWALVPAPAIPEGKLSHAQVAAWLQEYLDRLAKADVFSGTVLIARGNEVIFARPYGLASRAWNQPNRLDTKFNLGSMNKMFTAVAIGQLVEQGKVSLDDTIAKHLPDYTNRDVAAKVTVRHLLSHTSGLADYFNDKFMNASRARFRTIEDYFPLFADKPLEFEPGARFRYSNAGFMVLGAIVQKASGTDYFDYVREHIYRPAGMTNTDAYELDSDVPNLAVGYTRAENAKPGAPAFKNNLFLHVIKGGPAGGGYSTVEDLHRFANALRDGRLIKPDTLRQWTTPGQQDRSYGFGFAIYHASSPKVIGHSGGFPGISSDLSVDLDTGYVVAVMANVDGGAIPVTDKMKDLLGRVK